MLYTPSNEIESFTEEARKKYGIDLKPAIDSIDSTVHGVKLEPIGKDQAAFTMVIDTDPVIIKPIPYPELEVTIKEDGHDGVYLFEADADAVRVYGKRVYKTRAEAINAWNEMANRLNLEPMRCDVLDELGAIREGVAEENTGKLDTLHLIDEVIWMVQHGADQDARWLAPRQDTED